MWKMDKSYKFLSAGSRLSIDSKMGINGHSILAKPITFEKKSLSKITGHSVKLLPWNLDYSIASKVKHIQKTATDNTRQSPHCQANAWVDVMSLFLFQKPKFKKRILEGVFSTFNPISHVLHPQSG